MSKVFSVKGISDPAEIKEVEATIVGGILADTGESDEKGEKVYLKQREWFPTREKAEAFLRTQAENREKVRLKNLPDRLAKARANLAEIEAECRAAGIATDAPEPAEAETEAAAA